MQALQCDFDSDIPHTALDLLAENLGLLRDGSEEKGGILQVAWSFCNERYHSFNSFSFPLLNLQGAVSTLSFHFTPEVSLSHM